MTNGRVKTSKPSRKRIALALLALLCLLAIGVGNLGERSPSIPSAPPAPPAAPSAAAPPPPLPHGSSPAANPSPAPAPSAHFAFYQWTFDDLYDVVDGRPADREPSAEIPRTMDVPCGPKGRLFVQRSWRPTFDGVKTKRVLCDGKARFPTFLLGANYWRFSGDGLNWQPAVQLDIAPRFLPLRPRAQATYSTGSGFRLAISREGSFAAWVVETSSRPDFARSATRINLLWPRMAQISIPRAKTIWLRARGIASNGDLSEWSDATRVVQSVSVPRLAKRAAKPRALASAPAAPSSPQSEWPSLGGSLSTEGCQGLTCEIRRRQPLGIRGSVAAGWNYVRIDENLTQATAGYGNLGGPSLAAELAAPLSHRVALEGSVKTTPFIFNNDSIGSGQLSGQWQTFGAHAAVKSYSIAALTGLPGAEFEWLAGGQLHDLPIGLFTSSQSPVIRTVKLENASLGARLRFHLSEDTRATVFLRGQAALGSSADDSGASFSAKSAMGFDGSVGVDRRLSSMTWMGVHWYGQYQQFDFQYADPVVGSAGTQSTLFSTVELRMSVEY